jgi:Ca2+-transporting ATPase
MHVVMREGGGEDAGEVQTTEITKLEPENISNMVIIYANQTLRTIALCYRDFESWPLKDTRFMDNKRTEVCARSSCLRYGI